MTNHTDVVQRIKDKLVSQGVNLSGPCGAFEITKRVAWELRGEGAGLLDKPAGNNCQGYAVDIICYPAGTVFDILTDSGGTNGPAWNPVGLVDPSRYRSAFDSGDTPNLPEPEPDFKVIIEKLDRCIYLLVQLVNLADSYKAPVYTGKVLGVNIVLKPQS